MSRQVIIIGAGMGGLTASLRLARQGCHVLVFEARNSPGGLASSFELERMHFDVGPYILLDRPGLEWAFRSLGLELEEQVALVRLQDVYEVTIGDSPPIRFCASIGRTAAAFDRTWPGSGQRYIDFVQRTAAVYHALTPLLQAARPGLWGLLRSGAWRHVPFLMRSLRSVLCSTRLPQPLIDALAIWTHVAGQSIAEAPSPLAFVPVLIHGVGACYPRHGIGAVAAAVAAAALASGVEFHHGVTIKAIRCEHGRVRGVETDRGDVFRADAVVSNASGVGTYLELAAATPAHVQDRLRRLPLQSPGVCAYLAVKADMRPPYLRFHLDDSATGCQLLVMPGVLVPDRQRDGWWPARVIGTLDHATAQRIGAAGQRTYLERILQNHWWRRQVDEVRILGTRVPVEWGADFHLYQDSMNPVMTAQFMRAGRLAHRSPYVPGLYLAGSSTHPGQWVSFCAISGILAANRVLEDLR